MELYEDAPYSCTLQEAGRLNVYFNVDDRPVCGDAYVGYEERHGRGCRACGSHNRLWTLKLIGDAWNESSDRGLVCLLHG